MWIVQEIRALMAIWPPTAPTRSLDDPWILGIPPPSLGSLRVPLTGTQPVPFLDPFQPLSVSILCYDPRSSISSSFSLPPSLHPLDPSERLPSPFCDLPKPPVNSSLFGLYRVSSVPIMYHQLASAAFYHAFFPHPMPEEPIFYIFSPSLVGRSFDCVGSTIYRYATVCACSRGVIFQRA